MEDYTFKYKGKEYEIVENEEKIKNCCEPCCFKDVECSDIEGADCLRGGISFKYFFREVESKKQIINLNHIQEFTSFSDKVNFKEQMNKVREEFKEFSLEVYKNDCEHDRMAIVDEGLDLMVATFNLISKLGLDKADLDRHKKKLEGYRRSGKHGKVEG